MDITDIYEGLITRLTKIGMSPEKVTQTVNETIPRQLRKCYSLTENYKRDIYLSQSKTAEFCRKTDNNNRETALSAPHHENNFREEDVQK
jgi:hypothetical protein